ncbi:MAG: zinc ribbon domain-containing protein [Clostridia bacterium]|nr:zinc ribbon domain-containing protein [Clostridia bacterium]
MSTKECPNCGTVISPGQQFCPACGTRIVETKKTEIKNTNKYLDEAIARADTYASTVLYTKSKIVHTEVNQGELNFIEIIDKFPSETQSYIAYVNYMTKYIERVIHPKAGDEIIYFYDLSGMIEKCRMYLQKAIKYANNEVDGDLLQEVSNLERKLDNFRLDKSVEQKNVENKQAAKKGTVWAIVLIVIIVIGFLCRCA